ncbi:hypothetical protein Emag_003976 [Eimeria magna]
MAIHVSSTSSRPSLQSLSVALGGWSGRQCLLPLSKTCLFLLSLAFLKFSVISTASFSSEDLQGFEEANTATEGRQNYASDEGFSSASLFTTDQSLPFLDDADAVDASQLSDTSLASIQLAARNRNDAPTTAESEMAFPNMGKGKAARVKAAAAASLLLVLLAASVVALVARRRQAATAAGEAEGSRTGDPVRFSWLDKDAAVTAADSKIAYLVKLEARASELGQILESREAKEILHKITHAVETCKADAEAFHQNLQQNMQQRSDRLVADGWSRLSHSYSAAIEEIHRLLDTAPAFLRAQAEAASDAHLELMKMHVPIERLCRKAALEMEINLGESLLRVSEFAVSESLKQLQFVHEASARFTHSLAAIRDGGAASPAEPREASTPRTPAGARDLELVLQQAVAAAGVATRGRMRTGALLRDSTGLLEDTQKALILLSQSHTARLAVELVSKKIRMDLTCLELQNLNIPEALDDNVQRFVLTAQDVDLYVKEVQKVQQQLQETTDATDALSCFRRAHGTYNVAVTQIDEAPPVIVASPSEEDADAAHSAENGFVILKVAGESALVQQEEQNDKQRQERRRMLGAQVDLATDSGWNIMTEGSGLVATVLHETGNMLRELSSSRWFRISSSLAADLYGMWKQVEADSEKANKQLHHALQRLANVQDIKRLRLQAKKALNLKLELAGLCVDAVHHAVDCKAWALAERVLAGALADHVNAHRAFDALRQQQYDWQQRRPEVSFGGSLIFAFKKAFENEDLKAALSVVSKAREETREMEKFMQIRQPLVEGFASLTTPHQEKASNSAAVAAAAAAAAETDEVDARTAANELLHPLREEPEAFLGMLQEQRTKEA